jgi:hypothetical protein
MASVLALFEVLLPPWSTPCAVTPWEGPAFGVTLGDFEPALLSAEILWSAANWRRSSIDISPGSKLVIPKAKLLTANFQYHRTHSQEKNKLSQCDKSLDRLANRDFLSFKQRTKVGVADKELGQLTHVGVG